MLNQLMKNNLIFSGGMKVDKKIYKSSNVPWLCTKLPGRVLRYLRILAEDFSQGWVDVPKPSRTSGSNLKKCPEKV